MNNFKDKIQDMLNERFIGKWTDSQFFEAIQDILNNSGGKLYKYRRFDSDGHPLENLKNQILYCSKPSSFNDPFDCRLRLDIEDIINLHFPDFKPIMESAMSELLEKMGFSNRPDKCELQQLDNEQAAIRFQEILPSIIEAVSGPLERVMLQAGHQQDGVPLEILTDVLNSPGLNKLVSGNQEFDGSDVIRATYGIETEGDAFSLIEKVSELKNPEKTSELNEVNRKLYEIELSLRDTIDQNFFVGCLAENRDSVLMWSHYGDGHTGFCIEYDFNKLSLNEEQLIILPAIYSDDRPVFPIEVFPLNSDYDQKRAMTNFILTLLTKDSAWLYEKEWRIIRPSQQGNEVSLPIVSGVYLGANCSQANKDQILTIANQIQVPVYQMVTDRGKYKLHALPVPL